MGGGHVTKTDITNRATQVNGNQIKSENASARLKRPKKHYYDIHREIIASLLKHEERIMSQLAVDCGYAGRDKSSNVDDQIITLVKWGYLEKLERDDASPYRIKHDLDVVRQIYEDKKFESVRPGFSQSPWLLQFIVQKHLSEFSGDADFIEDLIKMLGTSSMMMIFFLRNNENPRLSLGVFGPSLPVAKMSDPPMGFLEPLTRKCIVYDLFASCMCLESNGGLTGQNPSDTSRRVFDEMKAKSVGLKLKTIRYIWSFTLLQTAGRCAEGTRYLDGQVHPVFDDIVDRFNKIINRVPRDVERPEPLEAILHDLDKLANETSQEWDKVSGIDHMTGKVDSIGPLSDKVLKNRI